MWIYDGRSDKKVPDTTHTATVVSSDRILCRQDAMTIRKKGRADWSILYCEAGCLYVEKEKLLPGQLWIYPPGVPQKYVVYARDETVYSYLHFTGSDMEALLKSLGILSQKVLRVKAGSFAEIMKRVQNSMKEEGTLAALQAEYHTLQLFSMLAEEKRQASPIHMMRRVTDAMEHSFMKEYQEEDYAAMLGMSVSRFQHLFKECMGISPYAWYLHVRLENARSLLEETDLKVKEIAEKCGYKDPLYFAQAFRKETGMTPTAYRKEKRRC